MSIGVLLTKKVLLIQASFKRPFRSTAGYGVLGLSPTHPFGLCMLNNSLASLGATQGTTVRQDSSLKGLRRLRQVSSGEPQQLTKTFSQQAWVRQQSHTLLHTTASLSTRVSFTRCNSCFCLYALHAIRCSAGSSTPDVSFNISLKNEGVADPADMLTFPGPDHWLPQGRPDTHLVK